MVRGIRDEGKVNRSKLIVQRVLARSRRKGWDDRHTAEVMVASLRPNRVNLGVVGPCFYCGDDLADTVDHIHPVSEGGGDERSNVVSSCLACNVLKYTSSLDEFLRIYPFGANAERNAALRAYLRTSPIHEAWLDDLMRRVTGMRDAA